jgi:hypothetical protein
MKVDEVLSRFVKTCNVKWHVNPLLDLKYTVGQAGTITHVLYPEVSAYAMIT